MASEVLKLIFRGQDDTTKAVRSLQGNLDKADKAVGKIKSSLGGMTGAIGLAAGIAGFGALAKSALTTADELGKVSQRLGTTASDLNSLQLAASYAGIETGTFNKLMEVFQKRLGEAAAGTGQAKDQLEAFGIDAAKLAELPLDRQLAIIADEFKNLETPAERAAAAADLFSNRGIKMINFLDNGSEGLGELRSEFKRLGLEVGDDSIDAIEDFNDSMTKVKTIVNQAMVVGLSKAAPQMEKFAENAAEMAVPLVGKLFDGLDWILDNIDDIVLGVKLFVGAMVVSKVIAFAEGIVMLGSAIKALGIIIATNPIGLIATAIAGAVAAIVIFRKEIMQTIQELDDFLGVSNKLGKAIDYVTGLFDDSDDQIKKNNKTTDQAIDATDDFVASIDDLKEIVVTATRRPLPKFADEVENIADEEQDAALETDEFREAIEKLQKAARRSTDDFEDAVKELEDFKKAVDAGRASSEDYDKALRNLIGGVTGVDDELGELRDEIQNTKDAIEILTDRFGENDAQVVALKKKLEELGGELVEAVKDTSSMSDSQKELLDEIKGTNSEIEVLKGKLADLDALYTDGAVSASEFAKASKAINDEIAALDTSQLDTFGGAVADAFSTESIAGFFEAIATGSSPTGALAGMVGTLVGSNGVKQAINDCFGTGPVTTFGDAVKALYDGSGSALGVFSSALGSLTGALGDFFAGGEIKFSAFKDAIIRTLSEIAAAAVASVGINFLKSMIPGLNTGGEVQGYAVGGRVRGAGGPKEDKVLARLSPGEYVINAASVSKFGTGFFDQLNAGMVPGFSVGGFISKWLNSNFSYIPGGGYSIDDVNWESYLQALFEAFDQADPRDDPLDPYYKATDIIYSRIAKAISDAAAMTENGIGTGVYSTGVIGEIIAGVLGPLDALGTQDFLNKFKYLNDDAVIDGLRDAVFDLMFGGASAIKASPINFNMDDVVARLFNSAQGTAGGSLTLAAREFGGPLERGQASVVGESGPELFVPGRGGTVSPIARDGGKELIRAVRAVKDEVASLRRQVERSSGAQLAGGRAR